MNNAASSSGSFVAARSTTGAWYVYRSTFSAAAYDGCSDCLAFETQADADAAAYDAELLGL